jgi:hypothetical protein
MQHRIARFFRRQLFQLRNRRLNLLSIAFGQQRRMNRRGLHVVGIILMQFGHHR